MPSLGMEGPFNFDSNTIDQVVTRTSAGNYDLGRTNEKGTFFVYYVGRSDTDLKQELKARLQKGHPAFMYSYAASPKAAFEKECKNFHDFGGKDKLENETHPARPDKTDWKCPVCDVFS